MINKKILAVAIAAAFSTNALAALNLDAATAATVGTINVATETYTSGDLDADGFLTVTTATLLDASAAAGFTINTGTSKYVRFDLVNAKFTGVPALLTDSGSLNFVATVSAGGAIGDSYVIFEVSDTVDILSDDVFTLDIGGLKVLAGSTATVQYRMFNSAPGAVNQTAGDVLKNSGADTAVTFGSAVDATKITIADTAEATVGSSFKAFTVENTPATANYATATIARQGELTVANALVAGSVTPAGVAVVVGDVFDTSQLVTFKGDFSFGTWSTSTANDCTALTALTLNTAKTEATTVATFDVTAADIYLCVTVNGTTVINKTSSPTTVTLADDNLTANMGTITYDTTSVSVPYVTTFSSYNQRIYLINSGSVAANYTSSFRSEAGVTATAGTKATGTIPANSVMVIKATDLVTLTGGTRTSATFEIEAVDTAIEGVSQSVNISTGGTDTVNLAVSSKY
ncbi:MAG: hypothetical protein GW763_14040 [Paraglaciecola sp.]|nr:hypothetical protein [Paraglaciecola sp.]NCT49075.1 hypothetical protein [Paraglaciecola sp.]